jgi:hypothetical protein
MSLTQRPNAQRSLDTFLLARRSVPFAWGSNDCALFAADAILAHTGIDIAADFRGKYSDEAGAFALIRSVTGAGTNPATAVGDVAAWCAQRFGLVEWASPDGKPLPLHAQRGDLVVMENGGVLIAGIVHLNGRHLVSMAESGPVRLPLSAARRAWKV